LNQFTPYDVDRYHSALAKPVDSIIRKRSNSMCHFHCLAGNSTIIFSTIQPFSVCEVFISSQSSTVRDAGWRRSWHVSNSGCL